MKSDISLSSEGPQLSTPLFPPYSSLQSIKHNEGAYIVAFD